jgi:hypothetical protein
MIIGLLALGFGVFQWIGGQAAGQFLMTLFFGVVLFGTGFINYREAKVKGK